MHFLYIMLLLFLAFITVQLNDARIRDSNSIGFVYATCMQAHTETNGKTEAACGAAQNKTHTEFLCTAANPVSYCWVEIK